MSVIVDVLTCVKLDVQTRRIKARTRRKIRRMDREIQREGHPFPPCAVVMELMSTYPGFEAEMMSVLADDTAAHNGRLFDLIAEMNRLALEGKK